MEKGKSVEHKFRGVTRSYKVKQVIFKIENEKISLTKENRLHVLQPSIYFDEPDTTQ